MRVDEAKRPVLEAFEPIRRINSFGGPRTCLYRVFERCVGQLGELLATQAVTSDEIEEQWMSLGHPYLDQTIQGCAFQQPYGYAGDFETIDCIYRRTVSQDPRCHRWDRYFHGQSAPRAVRNRKEYFKALVQRTEASCEGPVQVLNLGSGPCRDVLEYLEEHRGTRVRFTCVDQDSRAIDYARYLCRGHLDRIDLVEANVFRYRSKKRHDLVWSAGVMDYLDDRLATSLLNRSLRMAKPGAEAVLGNFSMDNPSRVYMEVVGRWYLHHRSARELVQLARGADVPVHAVRVGMEDEGVNLFLHVEKERAS